MAIQPLGSRIVAERIEEEQQFSGSIIIPDSAKEKGQTATIVATGPGSKKDDGSVVPLDVQVGETVMIGKFAGTDINVDGKDFVILTEDDILGVIED